LSNETNGSIGFNANGDRRLTILPSGNVGIGTTSPLAKFVISNSGAEGIEFGYSSGLGGNYLEGINRATGNPVDMNYFLSGSAVHKFITAGTERMRITSTGNVGIGTTSPSEKITLSDGKLFLTTNDPTIGGKIYGYNDTSVNLFSGGLKFETRFFNGSNYVYRDVMTINSSGNVGIGTTSPVSKLHIEGTGVGAWLTINRLDSNTNIIDFTQSGTRLGYLGYIGNDLILQNATNSNTLFTTNNTERMRITSGGNVGIGTTSPNGLLHLSGNSTSPITHIIENNNAVVNSSGTKLQFRFNGVETGFLYNFFDGGDFSTRLSSNGYLALQSGGANERMRITTNGDVCVGTTTANSRFNVTSPFGNTVTFNNTSGSSSASFVSFQASGNPIGGISRNGLANSVLYNTTSDYRLKEDFKNFKGLDLINNINVYNFKWKGVNQREYGVIAHELKEVIPNLVTGEKDAESMQQVDYSKLVPILVQAIQELKQEIEILKNK
jgi:hypothetical protein